MLKDRFRALADVRTDEDVKRLFERDAMADLIAGTRLFGAMRDKYGQKAFLYEFDPEIPGEDHPGSYHGSEMWFAYASLERCWRPFRGALRPGETGERILDKRYWSSCDKIIPENLFK